MDLSAPEIRVLGCLLEKQRTTPDAYPLSLNALRLACNQATNRDPVTEYDEAVIRDALHRLSRRRWARLASGAGSRAPKYRHLLDEALGLPEDELAVLCVLMLRGAQTPGELKQRTERLHPLADLSAVLDALERLIGRELAARLPRRPGQKEERYTHLLDDDGGRARRAGAGRAGRAGAGAAAPRRSRPPRRPSPAPAPAAAPTPTRASGGWRTRWPLCAPTSRRCAPRSTPCAPTRRLGLPRGRPALPAPAPPAPSAVRTICLAKRSLKPMGRRRRRRRTRRRPGRRSTCLPGCP